MNRLAVPVLVLLGWVGLAPGVLVSLRGREDSDAQLEVSWLVWAGYYVAIVVGAALWRIRDRGVEGSVQRRAVTVAVLLGVTVPVLVYLVVVGVTDDARGDGFIAGSAVAVVLFTITAWALAMLATFVGRLLTRTRT